MRNSLRNNLLLRLVINNFYCLASHHLSLVEPALALVILWKNFPHQWVPTHCSRHGTASLVFFTAFRSCLCDSNSLGQFCLQRSWMQHLDLPVAFAWYLWIVMDQKKHSENEQNAADEGSQQKVYLTTELFGEARVIIIRHDGMDYQLRITKSGKLLLCKWIVRDLANDSG